MNISPIGAQSLFNSSVTHSPGFLKPASHADFTSTLSDLSAQAIAGIKSAEANSFAALSGDASTREVVDAVMSAEQSLQIAVGIRDKIVSAFLEVSRMAI